jgi:hypothetical protein
MTDKPRCFSLEVGNVCRGRFTSYYAAEVELNRLEHLSRKRGSPAGVVARNATIRYIPQTYQEAQEAAFHERLP